MVQHSGRINEIEIPLERLDFQKIAMKELDIGNAVSRSSMLPISETPPAEINGYHGGIWKFRSHREGVTSCTAAGDQAIQTPRRKTVIEGRESFLYVSRELLRLSFDESDPSRVGSLLVLLSHLDGNLIFNAAERGDAGREVLFQNIILNLAIDQFLHIFDVLRENSWNCRSLSASWEIGRYMAYAITFDTKADIPAASPPVPEKISSQIPCSSPVS